MQVASENVKNTTTYYCKILRSRLDWTNVGKKIILPVKFESNYDIVRARKGQKRCLKKSDFINLHTRGKSILESWGTTFLPTDSHPNLCLIYFKIT